MKAIACMLCIVALLPAMAAAAPATQSYHNTTLHYGVRYPQDWTALGVPGADFGLKAQDGNGFLSITVAPGIMGAVRQQQIVKRSRQIFSPFGTLQATPESGPLHVPGTTGTLIHATVTGIDGTPRVVYAFVASYGQRNYTVVGVVRNVRTRTARTDAAELLTIIKSMSFFG